MPNRDHDDSPYNRHEARSESPRDERDDYRSESLRSSRDWNRHDYRAGERNSDGNQYGSGYNPSRDDHDFRGGSRFDERSSYDRGYARPDWGRAGEYDRSREWGGRRLPLAEHAARRMELVPPAAVLRRAGQLRRQPGGQP
jgi:hypothetical protein